MSSLIADQQGGLQLDPYRINIHKETGPKSSGIVTGGGGLGGIGPLPSVAPKLNFDGADSLDIFGGMLDMHGRKKY